MPHTEDVNAFHPETSGNGQVNDSGNPVLNAIKKRLLRKNNAAPAAKFIQRQQKLKDTLKKLNEN
tara:strand:- start:533 stop:727 length:195 start_codon:yes stop_codon:yes gene_type:complete